MPLFDRRIAGRMPLSYAAEGGFEAPILLLIRAGASIHSLDKKKQSPLHYAAVSGHASLAGMLAKRGARYRPFLSVQGGG